MIVNKVKPKFLLFLTVAVICIVLLYKHSAYISTVTGHDTESGAMGAGEFCPSITYTCMKNNLSMDSVSLSPKVMKRLYVDDLHKTIGCVINKAGCSTWKYIMMNSTGKIPRGTLNTRAHVHNRELMETYGIKGLDSYTQEEVQYRLHNYYKFIVVRNPYERLYSAYRDKFVVKNKSFHRFYGKKIIAKFRKNATEKDLQEGNNVKFGEFVDYLSSDLEYFDLHWMTYSEFCDPCRIRYDKVVRLDNVEKDAVEVFSMMGIDTVSIPHMNMNKRARVVSIEEPYSQLSNKQYSSLNKVYGIDFDLFGFSWDTEHNSGSCKCCT